MVTKGVGSSVFVEALWDEGMGKLEAVFHRRQVGWLGKQCDTYIPVGLIYILSQVVGTESTLTATLKSTVASTPEWIADRYCVV